MLINPGSRIAANPSGWTNTFEKAQAEARRWLESIVNEDGMSDVEISRFDPVPKDGRWSFWFRHRVTGVEVELETHGINDLDAYCKQAIFTPRVYWKGGSSSQPRLEDFGAPGFKKLVTYVPVKP